jgi:hypothetical protein
MERLLLQQQQQQQQQQRWQQQQQPHPEQLAAVLADSVMKLWGTVILQTAASNSSTAASFLSSSSSSSSRDSLNAAAAVARLAVTSHRAVPEVGDTWAAAMFVAEQLLIALFREVNSGRSDTAAAAAGSSASQQLQHWQQLLHSPQVLWLLCLSQAIHAQNLQHQVQSRSSSSSPQAVPAYHEQMFAALGVTATSAQERAASNPFLDASGLDSAVLCTSVVSRAIWRQLFVGLARSDGSSSSSSNSQQQQLFRQVLTLLQPWVLLQLELLLLMTEGTCKQMLLENIVSTYSIGLLVHVHMGSGEATVDAFRRSLLHPVLQLALPHMQEYIAEFARDDSTVATPGSRAASSDQRRDMQAEVLQELETHWFTILLESTAWFRGMCSVPRVLAAYG